MKFSFAWSLVAVGVLGASALACSQPVGAEEEVEASEHSIVGGVEAEAGSWAGAAALYIGGGQACGGTLVADTWVLTAGHCVNPNQTNGGITKVVVGRHKLSGTGGESITVKKAYRHPGYSSQTLDNDIALLELTSASTAPKAKLATAAQQSELVANAKVTVVGWGLTRENGSQSDVLRQVEVPVISNAQCESFPNYDITANMICAGLPAGGKDSCQGDSGGPLFLKVDDEPLQVGVVSWGIGCARPNSPGVYTRVGNYLEWLSTTSGGAISAGGGEPGEEPGGGGEPSTEFTPFEETGSVTRGQEKAFSYDAPAGPPRDRAPARAPCT